MKVIIAGSRCGCSPLNLYKALEDSRFLVHEVVSGCARGVDRLGEQWAADNNVPIKRFPAAWGKHGRKAGFMRNVEMAEYADALVAIWDGKSHGTKHMIDTAQARGLKVHVLIMEA